MSMLIHAGMDGATHAGLVLKAGFSWFRFRLILSHNRKAMGVLDIVPVCALSPLFRSRLDLIILQKGWCPHWRQRTQTLPVREGEPGASPSLCTPLLLIPPAQFAIPVSPASVAFVPSHPTPIAPFAGNRKFSSPCRHLPFASPSHLSRTSPPHP